MALIKDKNVAFIHIFDNFNHKFTLETDSTTLICCPKSQQYRQFRLHNFLKNRLQTASTVEHPGKYPNITNIRPFHKHSI